MFTKVVQNCVLVCIQTILLILIHLIEIQMLHLCPCQVCNRFRAMVSILYLAF